MLRRKTAEQTRTPAGSADLLRWVQPKAQWHLSPLSQTQAPQ